MFGLELNETDRRKASIYAGALLLHQNYIVLEYKEESCY